MTGWQQLQNALDRRSEAEVVGWLIAASEPERVACFAAVRGYGTDHSVRGLWDEGLKPLKALALLGCAPNAKQAATALAEGEFRWWWDQDPPMDAFLTVLRQRQVPWLGALAAGLAAKLPLSRPAPWRLTEAAAQESGMDLPTNEAFVAGWIADIRRAKDPDLALAASPYRTVLLPKLFEHEKLAQETFEYSGERGFLAALRRLAAVEPAVRLMLFDGCRARLLGGGRPGDLRAFVLLHGALSPQPNDVADAIPDYLALLGAEQSTVVTLAQKALRMLDEAGRLDPDNLVEISHIVLGRTEKVLIKAQTSWLRAAARRDPADRARLLALLAVPDKPEMMLPTPFVATPVPAMPPPIGSPAELAEEVAAMLAGDSSTPTIERVLAGLVILARTDRDAVVAALDPFLGRSHDLIVRSRPLWIALATMAGGPAVRAAAEPAVHELRARMTEQLPRLGHGANFSLSRVLEYRLAEIGVHGMSRPLPMLLATPTEANGWLDPAVLLDRLSAFERAGRQPWPTDLAQALLRLPREHDATLTVRAAALESPAGIAFAARLRDGHPDPVSSRHQQHAESSDRTWGTRQPARRVVVALSPPAGCSTIEQRIFTLVAGGYPRLTDWWANPDPHECAAVLPSHRDVVAAWALPSLATQSDADSGRGAAALLPLLAETGGPVGPAIALAMVYALSTKNATERIAAVDALLAFGALPDFATIGHDLGELGADGILKINRAAAALGEAARAGAVAAVWEICQAALPALLAAAKPRPGTVELVEVANLCAQALGVRAIIPAVDQAAARGGSGRLVTEARRLRTTLKS